MSITYGTSRAYQNPTNRRGDLKQAKKQEFADLMLQYAEQALVLKDRETMEVELPDGRLLRFWHILFPACPHRNLPELREWSVHLYTLKPNCVRRWNERQAWLYLAPYHTKSYKTDPSNRWCYSVWR